MYLITIALQYNIAILRSHQYSKHRYQDEHQEKPSEQQDETHLQEEQQQADQMQPEEELGETQINKDDNQRRAALFILKLKEERKVPQSTLDDILGDI